MNGYMQDAAPWDVRDEDKINGIIYLIAESLRICGILLQPYMPSKMQQLLDQLGVDPDKRSFRDVEFGTDRTFGTPLVPVGKGHEGVLFPALSSIF